MQNYRLTENRLRRLIRESVEYALNENFGDKISGAIAGFKRGETQMDYDESDAHFVDYIYKLASDALYANDPHTALVTLKKIAKLIENTRSGANTWRSNSY